MGRVDASLDMHPHHALTSGRARLLFDASDGVLKGQSVSLGRADDLALSQFHMPAGIDTTETRLLARPAPTDGVQVELFVNGEVRGHGRR